MGLQDQKTTFLPSMIDTLSLSDDASDSTTETVQSPVSPVRERSCIPVRDESMDYAVGSVLFLVENVLFRIPKALLQQHSQGFEGMLGASSEDSDPNEPIVLDDTVSSFTLFREVLMHPFSSSLTPGHPTNTMENLTDILIIANKYVATAIEDLALQQLIPRSQSDLSSETMIRLIDVGLRVNSSELQKCPRAELTKLAWAGKLSKEDSLHLLRVAKRWGDSNLLSTCYYAISLHGEVWWRTCSIIDADDSQRVLAGMMLCAREWQAQNASWVTEGLGCTTDCRHLTSLLHYSTKRQAAAEVQWFDILGKLNATLAALDTDLLMHPCLVMDTNRCRNVMRKRLLKVQRRVKSNLSDWYLADSDKDEES